LEVQLNAAFNAAGHSRLLAGVLARMPQQLWIDGSWTASSDHSVFAVENPATGEPFAWVADATPADGRWAVRAAAGAQREWAATASARRADILRRTQNRLLERIDELALLMTTEMGKPLAEARTEVAYAATFFGWFAEESTRIAGTYGDAPDGTSRILIMRRPVGPCLLITPWNFPLAMAARKIAPALAAGCAVVLKPAPQTPLSSLALAGILSECGAPRGVVNVIPTSRAAQVIEPIMRDGILRKISFTGSTEVGKVLLGQAAKSVMRTSMELGGNAPFIVFADADLDAAVDAAMTAKMRNMGEACTAANRFFVHRSVAADFTASLVARMSRLTVGDGVTDRVEVGPLIDAPSVLKVTRLVDDAIGRGARVVARGPVPDIGYFVAPTVLIDVPADCDLMNTEIFGPVAAIRIFDHEDEVIAAANDTDWGLVAYVMTRDLQRALRISEALEVGMVGLNTGSVSNPAAPFGGMKQSGLGREGGRVGIDEFLEYRYVAVPSTA
jgi:succinate-semialdehyde dehydrogenase/glutarate-semialdehyde dehydrogenase